MFATTASPQTSNTMSSQEKTTNNNLSKDVEIPNAPTDSISSISFSPQADFLAVGSWDNNVRTLALSTGP